jgi:hypothetical protein
VTTTVAGACKLLESTADRAQDLIFELVRVKCDELLNIGGINWEQTAAPDRPRWVGGCLGWAYEGVLIWSVPVCVCRC